MSTFYYLFPVGCAVVVFLTFVADRIVAGVKRAVLAATGAWLDRRRRPRGRHVLRGPARRRLDAAYRAGRAWLSPHAGRGPAEANGIDIVRAPIAAICSYAHVPEQPEQPEQPETEAGEEAAKSADEEPSPFDPLTASDIRRLVLADTALFAGDPPAAPEWATHSDMTGYLPKFDARVLAELDAQRERVGAAA